MRRSCIGIEIQPHEIRLLQLSNMKQQLILDIAAHIDLPQGAIVDGQILKFDSVCLKLQELVHSLNSRTRFAVVALPIQCVISKRIQLTTDDEHEAEIAPRLNDYFPSIQDELTYDYLIQDKNNALQKQALLVAARADQVTTYVSVVEAAGLKVNIVDVDVYALMRAAYFNIPKHHSILTSALLWIGTSSIQLMVMDHYEIILLQQFQNDNFKKISAQLKCALQLVCATHQHLKMTQIYIAGKISTDKVHDIQVELGLDIFYVNPFVKMSLSSKIHQEMLIDKMLVSCGLALRGMKI